MSCHTLVLIGNNINIFDNSMRVSRKPSEMHCHIGCIAFTAHPELARLELLLR
jgi:hypothetical protein